MFTHEIDVQILEEGCYNCFIHQFEDMTATDEVLNHVDALCTDEGLTPIGQAWRKIDEETAKRILWHFLKYDVVFYNSSNGDDDVVGYEFRRLLDSMHASFITACWTNVTDTLQKNEIGFKRTGNLTHADKEAAVVIASMDCFLFFHVFGEFPED